MTYLVEIETALCEDCGEQAEFIWAYSELDRPHLYCDVCCEKYESKYGD